MARVIQSEHFNANQPLLSRQRRGGGPEHQASSKGSIPLSNDGAVHYGHSHAKTEELYRKHREEHELMEAMRINAQEDAQQEQEPLEASEEFEKRQAEDIPRDEVLPTADSAGLDLKELAQQAVSSVVQAGREAIKGRPLVGARQLADDALSGTLRVVREVSARTGQFVEEARKSSLKEPGKNH
jgi:hypothetical protein